jgi:hypothetical protein
MNYALRLCLTLAVCAAAIILNVNAQEDDPTINSWMINTDGTTGSSPDEEIDAIVSQYLADVLAVYYNDTDVYINANSIPSHPIGPFNDGNPSIPVGVESHYRFPRTTPEPAFELTSVGLGAIGIFINGVAMYNYSDAESYEDKGIWLNNAIYVRASGFDSGQGHPSPIRDDQGGGGMTPPDNGGGTPPDNGGGTPPDNGSGTPPDNGGGTPPDNGGGTPPDNAGGTPPDNGGGTPPDNGGGTPPDNGGGGGTPPNGGGGTPPSGGGGTPPNGGGGTPPNGGGGPGTGPSSIFPLTKDTSVRYIASKIAQENQTVESAMPAAHRMMHEYEILHTHVAPSQQQGPGGEGQQGPGGEGQQGGGETVTGFYHYHQQPPLLREQIGDDGSKHSPVIGYMFDGFPVYGPYGYDNVDGTGEIVRIESSYKLRDMTDRSTLSDGTVLSADEQGPPVNDEYPLGYFVQDYEFVDGYGHLDEFNGRYAVTPEYPNGVYAYFATIGEDGESAFPYLIGPNYYGEPDVENIMGQIEVPDNAVEYQPENAIQEWVQY